MTENRWDSNGPIRHAGPPVVPGQIAEAMARYADAARASKPAASRPPILDRVIEIVRNLLAIIALGLAIVIMLGLMELGSALGDAIDRANAPDPVVTGCPFGEENCGG